MKRKKQNKQKIYLNCFYKGKNSLFEITTSSYLTISSSEIQTKKNLIDTLKNEKSFEIYLNPSNYYLTFLENEKFLKNQKIFFPDFIFHSPYFLVKKNKTFLNSDDVINVDKNNYLVATLIYNQKNESIKYQKHENTSQITTQNGYSLYKNREEIKNHCFFCKKDTEELYLICDCKFTHVECFTVFFAKFRKIKFSNQNCVITYHNFFCNLCKQFYYWFYSTQGKRKMFIDFKEFENKHKFIFLIKFNQKSFFQKKYIFVFIPILDIFQKFKEEFGIVELDSVNSEDTYIVGIKKEVKLFSFGKKKMNYGQNHDLHIRQENLNIKFF